MARWEEFVDCHGCDFRFKRFEAFCQNRDGGQDGFGRVKEDCRVGSPRAAAVPAAGGKEVLQLQQFKVHVRREEKAVLSKQAYVVHAEGDGRRFRANCGGFAQQRNFVCGIGFAQREVVGDVFCLPADIAPVCEQSVV